MDDRSKNVSLVAVIVIAIVGWGVAFGGGFANIYPTRAEQQMDAIQRLQMEMDAERLQMEMEAERRQQMEMEAERIQMEMEAERLRTTVYYGYYNNGGNIACIETGAGGTSSIEIYAENIYAPDAVIDFTLTAKNNADVSLEASDGFQQSVTKRLTVFEGTQTLRETFFVKPHPDVDSIQLALDAKAINPLDINLVYTLEGSGTIVFSNDGSGNYCP